MKGRRQQSGQVLASRIEKCQWLEHRLVLWRPRFYKSDWLMRAGAAKGGILRERCRWSHVSLYPRGWDGETLDGSKHNYTITFPAGSFRREFLLGR